MPPSTCKTWPVIQPAFSESKNAAMLAMSFVLPILFNGCRNALASFFCSVFNKEAASGVSVNEGAIQFTLIAGAYSAANDFVSPSMAPLDAETWV